MYLLGIYRFYDDSRSSVGQHISQMLVHGWPGIVRKRDESKLFTYLWSMPLLSHVIIT